MIHKVRLGLDDTAQTAVVKLCEGNPGALRVCIELMQCVGIVDPYAAFGPIGPLLDLDYHGIYGPRIWMLYKDACGEDITVVLATLRAVQLGLQSESWLNNAIDHYGVDLDPAEVLAQVQEHLPKFAEGYVLKEQSK